MFSSRSQQLLFIAILPPQAIQDGVNQIKQEFAERYASQAAQKSPPHITLQPPFECSMDKIAALQDCLQVFGKTQPSLTLGLKGFGAFPPRVIYINVLEAPVLFKLQQSLSAILLDQLDLKNHRSKHPFVPHMTVAFRDLTPQNFRAAWPNFQDRSFECEFVADALTLLLHNGEQWIAWKNFSLSLN